MERTGAWVNSGTTRWLRRVCCLLLALPAGAALAQTAEPVTYTLRFPEPHTHYVSVEASVPTGGRHEIELMMAVWTPGSYLIREFARHVEEVTARTPTGGPLTVEKSRKNRWRVSTDGADRIVVSYLVYGREMSVRTNWIEADFAILNGAPTFLTIADDDRVRPHDVTLELPTGWRRSVTGLTPRVDRGPHTYRAADFDTLVDSPIVAGAPTVYEFAVDDTPHLLVNLGESGVWHGPRSAEDVEKITREIYRMWGVMPYDRYLFLNMITEAGGGLEHRNSAMLMSSRWATSSHPSYLRWLGLVSHELFHAWNVKQLRPIELGPFDYEHETHTRSLWVVEGLTSYYADLIVHRSGLSDVGEYLEALSRQIRGLQTTPGRGVQPLSRASYDAWIKYYRTDENSPNSSVSYYTKGAVLGFLLDMRVRAATQGAKTLDDVMRLAYARFSADRGFTPLEFRATAREVAGTDLSAWFTQALDTTEETGLRGRPRLARPRVRGPGRGRGAGVGGTGHALRQQPSAGPPGASRHPCPRCRFQRRRRDPGHRRPQGPGEPVGRADRSDAPWHPDPGHGLASWRAQASAGRRRDPTDEPVGAPTCGGGVGGPGTPAGSLVDGTLVAC